MPHVILMDFRSTVSPVRLCECEREVPHAWLPNLQVSCPRCITGSLPARYLVHAVYSVAYPVGSPRARRSSGGLPLRLYNSRSPFSSHSQYRLPTPKENSFSVPVGLPAHTLHDDVVINVYVAEPGPVP